MSAAPVSVTSPARYPSVFEPLQLGPVTVPNRIYFSPHGVNVEADADVRSHHRVPAVDYAYYMAERVAGGVGLVFHSMQVGPFALQPGMHATPGIATTIPDYARVADLVHANGGKIMAEIWYIPWQPHNWDSRGPDAPQMSPSALQNVHMPSVRYAMRKSDIQRTIESHVVATRNLREAGYDGIEIHASHGALLEYFLSPYYNRRDDEYGGSLENRARIIVETLVAVREAAGPDMAVGMRLTADQLLKGGVDAEGMREFLDYLVPMGLLDFLDLDISVEPEQMHLLSTGFFEPRLHNAPRVEAVSPSARPLPVLSTAGRVTNLAEAERLLGSGFTDMVGIVRGLIAEPFLVRIAREGRESDSRLCVAANHCMGGIQAGPEVWGCAINPAAGRESRFGMTADLPASASLNVVVVGGGPAGMEAAHVAAKRGHRVTLLEAGDRLGGGLQTWGAIPGRESLRTLPAYFSRRLPDQGVDVRLGTRASVEDVLALEPDVVFVATGSHYDRTGESGFRPFAIEGHDRDFVVSPEDVILGRVELSGTVVVLDEEGLHAAGGVAEIAAAAGADVHFITRKPVVADGLVVQSRYIMTRLREHKVTINTMTYIASIGDHVVELEDVLTGDRTVLDDVSTVVLATKRTAVDELADPLAKVVKHVYLVGDALAPRTLREATYEGHRFARLVGEPDMPASTIDLLFEPIPGLLPASTITSPESVYDGVRSL